MRRKIITRRHLWSLATVERRLKRIGQRVEHERRPWADSTCYTLAQCLQPLERFLSRHLPPEGLP